MSPWVWWTLGSVGYATVGAVTAGAMAATDDDDDWISFDQGVPLSLLAVILWPLIVPVRMLAGLSRMTAAAIRERRRLAVLRRAERRRLEEDRARELAEIERGP